MLPSDGEGADEFPGQNGFVLWRSQALAEDIVLVRKYLQSRGFREPAKADSPPKNGFVWSPPYEQMPVHRTSVGRKDRFIDSKGNV
jgi:hypothetical protein